jgi:hypothetical protein
MGNILGTMAGPGLRHIDIDSLVDDMRSPTDDDVPMTSDWQPLDTKDKLLAYLNRINEAREHDRAG